MYDFIYSNPTTNAFLQFFPLSQTKYDRQSSVSYWLWGFSNSKILAASCYEFEIRKHITHEEAEKLSLSVRRELCFENR